MKSLIITFAFATLCLNVNAQNNRFELGPYSENNNWLFYAKPDSPQLEIAPRIEGNTGVWGYKWDQSLLYNVNGQLSVGTFYGFRQQNGGIGFNGSNQSKIDFFYSGSSTNSGQLRLAYGAASGSQMIFGINTDSGFDKLMSLDQSNNQALLTVGGNVHSKEVKVSVEAGADFVFESTYSLRTLEETEEFISKNNHLPEIASEKEMLANGLKLSEMNIKLLQKIEELTLYLIEQNERVEKLEKEVSTLKKH